MDNTAVVILNYNGLSYLKQFLPAVVENNDGYQVVVIDNCSTDQSVTYLNSTFPEVELVRLNQNFGFSGGYNRGLQSIDAEYYILLNSDVQVTPNWTGPIIKYLHDHPEVGICQPKIRSHQDPQRFDYAGAAGGFLDILGYPYCRGRLFDTLEADEGQYDDNQLIFWAGGACMAIRRSLFRQLGGFDEDFFAHMEEIDLCWRSQKAGHLVAYVGDSTVYHVGGGTLASTNAYKTFLNFRNGLSLILKNSTFIQLIWKLPLRMWLDGIAALRFLIKGSWGHFWAVVRAEFAFILSIPKTWRKRADAGTTNVVKLHNRIIVWDYFVLGRKYFKNL